MASMELIKKVRDLTQAGIMDAKKSLELNNDDVDKAIQWLREKGIAKAAKKAGAIATEGISKVIINGDWAIILEINCETDFVAKNEAFLNLIDMIGNKILEAKEYDIEKALELKLNTGNTIDIACKELTGKIGEKILLRRYEIIKKDPAHQFSSYEHTNGKIAVLLCFNNKVPAEVGKDIAMHAAAMAPKFLNASKIDPAWLENETKILKEQTLAEGKPADRAEMIVKGRINKLLSEVTLEAQAFVKDNSKTVKKHINEHNADAIFYVRYEVGEGIEKKVVDFAAEVAAQVRK